MIREKNPYAERVIDLTGPQGNAFVLLGLAQDLCRQLELDPKAVLEEMKSSDYENLIQTFDKYFGEYYTLER